MAQEQPQAPPEGVEAVEDEDDKQGTISPFLTVEAGGADRMAVRAGWADGDGEVQSIVLDWAGPVAQSRTVFEAAFSWYAETIASLSAGEEA